MESGFSPRTQFRYFCFLVADVRLKVDPCPLGVNFGTVVASTGQLVVHVSETLATFVEVVSAVLVRVEEDRVSDGFVTPGVPLDKATLVASQEVFL